MRNQLPADPIDRIVEQERELEALTAEVRGLRRQRVARGVTPRPAFTVQTTEWFDDPGYSYPTGASATPDLRLPISVMAWELDDDGRPTYSTRTEYASHWAFCPLGWYPPGITMSAYWDGTKGQFVIVDAPRTLKGRTTTAITTASWSSDELTLGTGTAIYYSQQSGVVFEPATYEDDSDVTLNVYNVADEIATNRGVKLDLSEIGLWEATVEPCNLVYS